MTILGAVLGLVVLLLLATVGVPRREAFAQRPNLPASNLPSGNVAGGDGLLAFTSAVGEKTQMLTVVDPRQQVVSVYHVDTHSGEITLKSVRNIHWDLQMSEFNGVSPLPREIRALAEPR
ncbi:MAG TPA: hypothetical protein VFE24_12250 [Pirellulales bacterium]|jgi:hypothetical protein|nr:hypothetical protein [Pirellulales bacterium]